MKRRLFCVLCFVLVLFVSMQGLVFADNGLLEVKELIKNCYVQDVEEDVLGKNNIKEMVDTLNDPYSTYLTPETFKDYLSSLDGRFTGVGMHIQQVGNSCQVVSPMPGSPAEKAGIKPGDIITHVDGESVEGLNSTEVAAKIRGPEGTKVSVTVKRGSEALNFIMVRKNIILPTVEYRKIGPNIGYIKLDSFNSASPAELSLALDCLIDQKVETLVLDLRNNPGGLLNVAVAIAGEFVPKGPVVHVIQKGNQESTLRSFKIPRGLPVAVLVNGGTASAAEILAGAIQDAKTGIIIGAKTFGKGSVQTVFALSNGGGLKLTTAKYLTRGRQDINLKGLTPDFIENNENKQLEKAVKSLGDEIRLYAAQISLDSPLAFAGYGMYQLPALPYQEEGLVMVPLRSVAGYLGAEVKWEDGKAEVKSSQGKVVVDMEKEQIIMPDSQQVISGRPVLKNGLIMIPVRALTEPLGYNTIWQATTRSVAIMH
ncbi:MAG: S41 family peptidase [Bacillota bacterium]